MPNVDTSINRVLFDLGEILRGSITIVSFTLGGVSGGICHGWSTWRGVRYACRVGQDAVGFLAGAEIAE